MKQRGTDTSILFDGRKIEEKQIENKKGNDKKASLLFHPNHAIIYTSNHQNVIIKEKMSKVEHLYY